MLWVPWIHAHFCQFTSPIGLVPRGSTGKWRLIVDLSSPHDRRVNDGIDPAFLLRVRYGGCGC